MAQLEHIEAIEKRLWNAADTLRANSNYASNEYFLPVMGLIFLRRAYSRFLSVKDAIEPNLPKRGGRSRALTKEDFSQRSAIFLRPEAQFDTLVALPDSADRVQAVIEAMESIEGDYENLRGVLPKSEYQELDNDVLGQLLRTLNPDELKRVSGDVFGRIYEYFLTQFADQKAHDGGEFFTPVSLVSLIANVLEPEVGTVLDPACGSGGMFVQSARFVERQHGNPTDNLTFRGLEKNATTIRLAKMNLAVHGLEGDIQKAITYYEDPHELLGKADYVMANPPFNVDEIDADTIPHLFHHNAAIMLGNGDKARIGSISSQWGHFDEWKRLAEEEPGAVDMETLLKGVCDKRNFLDLVENFILFDDSTRETRKILARNHQFLGVNRAIEAVKDRKNREGKLGVFWHTQGAGKSYSMVMFARKVHRRLGGNFTFLILTDRDDLDTQIYKTFAGCGVVDNDRDPCRAASGDHLSGLLAQHKSYVFSLIQKFSQDVRPEESYTQRDDTIVVTDEAHRTQYGTLALNMRNALPNASYIGFTGTPLFKEDEITRRVFGEYVSTYDFQRAVEDKATLPLYYDARGDRLGVAVGDLNERIAEKLEELETQDIDVELRLERELKRDYHIITADTPVCRQCERWVVLVLDGCRAIRTRERNWGSSFSTRVRYMQAHPRLRLAKDAQIRAQLEQIRRREEGH